VTFNRFRANWISSPIENQNPRMRPSGVIRQPNPPDWVKKGAVRAEALDVIEMITLPSGSFSTVQDCTLTSSPGPPSG
jgi:hypothetical protein